MENLIEELTKVNPSNLSEEGLKLFNKINEIIDRNGELEEENKKLKGEREYIKNNLKVDLNRKGVFSQAKGQIAQILEYYEENEKYLKEE